MKKTLLLIALLAPASMMFGADAKAGGAIYDKSCKGCHGASGEPNAAIAKMMPTIPDFSKKAVTDAEVKTAVTAGKGKMKAIAAVPATSIDDLAAYVHTLKK